MLIQIHEFLQFDEENWKKERIISQKLIFGQTYMKFDAMATSKMMDRQLTYQNSAENGGQFQLVRLNRVFKTQREPYGIHPPPPPPPPPTTCTSKG